MNIVSEFFRDFRFGARLLRRSAGFTFIAVVSLGLGIGGATAVFTLVNAVVLRSLPVPEPHQLFRAQSHAPGQDYGELFSAPMFEQLRAEVAPRGVELFAATSPNGVNLQPAGEAVQARGSAQLVSGEYFGALRQRAQFGRLLGPDDNRVLGGHPVAVISDGYWRRRLNGQPDAIGRHLTINGATFTIVGITTPTFFGTTLSLRAPDVWIPFMMQPAVRYSANASNSGSSDTRKPWPPQKEIAWLNVFGRVTSPGAEKGSASTLTTVYQRERESLLTADAPEDDRAAVRRQTVTLEPASSGVSALRDTVAKPLYVVLAMVGVLLAIACGNVAGLLLARATGRAREMAIRQSLGAGRARLIRQVFAESLLLAAAGCAFGITFAVWARDALLGLMVNLGSLTAPIDLNTGLDGRVLGFSLGVSALTGIACGVLPALRGTRVSVADSLKQDGRGSVTEGGRRGLFVGRTLVAAQMAFCLLLLVVAGLFTRSLQSLIQTEVGFDRDHVLAARVDVRGAGYTPEERQALYRRLVERLQAIPGVQSASMSANGPFANSQRISSLSVEGFTPAPSERIRTNEEIITERYFETMGLRILEGRNFGPEDRIPGSRTTIVNATMARRFFPGQSAIGKRWDYGDEIGRNSNVIVGVVEDARYVEIRTAPPNMTYRLADVSDDVLGDIEIRTAGNPAALARTLRETLTQTEPRLPIVDISPLTDRIARGVMQDRMIARLTTIFGALALLLASLGLYGTVSYGVNRRVAELGLRMALGADRNTVLWMVLREALALVLVGALIGIPLAFLAARSMQALLFNVGAGDPTAFVLGGVLLMAVAAVAAYLPAYRASRIEPMVALGR
jgi:predicted permease